MSLLASSSRAPERVPRRRWWRPRRLVLLAAVLPLLALAACHQEFGTAPHGGPAVGSGHPTARDLRAATHPGYDRVVVEFNGTTVPEYFVEYVAANQLVGPSGQPVPVAGNYFLRLRMSGLTTAPAPVGLSRTFPELRQVKLVDGSEGLLVYGVGVLHRNPFRVFALTGPPRVVLDIAN